MRSIKLFTFLLISLFCLQTVNAEWVKQNTNTLAWFRDVFFVNASKGWIVGDNGTVMATTDGGTTWTPSKKFTNDKLLQVHFTDEMNGWMLCERDIYSRGANALSYLRKTTDGGVTWNKIDFEGAGRERVTKLLFSPDGKATAFGEGGVFYKLQEDGVTWKKVQTFIRFLLLDGSFGDERIGAIVGAGGTIMFTDDSGFSWEKATLLGDTDTKFNAVYFAGTKGGWAVGTQGHIFRSNGGAKLWRQQRSDTTSNLNDVYFSSPANGWAVGDDGTILRTRDGGNVWFKVNSRTTHRLNKISFAGDRGWAVGFGGTILSYDEGGSNTDPGAKPNLQRRS
ncbi:MAG TPA: YCF48-related protein [Pyrinomonadaceae bacterium]|nr:YCF48-related protein [Pyrinomonadaceae bacterium]